MENGTKYCLKMNRRNVLLGSLAISTVGLLNVTSNAWSSVEESKSLLADFTSGKTPQNDRVILKLPKVAENGHIVPVSVLVDSPMQNDDFVESIMILAELNPNAKVATFGFTPASGKAEVSTRMRLAKSQTVLALAKMNDGKVFINSQFVEVTVGGCGA